MIYSLYGYRHSRLLDHVPALPAHLKSLAPATMILAAVVWWVAPHPWSLIVPILMLIAISFYALHAIDRRAA